MINFAIVISLLIGLVIFLFGIENFTQEIKKVSSERFAKFLRKATSNRFFAALSGMGTSALFQSNTATIVISVSLVSAGFISFAHSLGIIFGSNIGATITAQLIALKLTAFAPFLMIVGFILGAYGGRYKYIGKALFYFGLVFFGLTLMANAVSPIKDNPDIINYFSKTSNIFFALLVGFVFTAIVRSSAVTIGMVIVFAGQGMLSLEQGIPILLGANLGSTLTAILVASRLNLYAKRVAVANLLFSVIGVALILPFIGIYTGFIASLGGNTGQQIANAHTIFNVFAAVFFLIILTPFQRLVELLVPGKEEEILLKTKYLNEKIPSSNKEAFEKIEKEIKYLLETDDKMFEIAHSLLNKKDRKELDRLQRYGKLSNMLSHSIGEALYELSQRKLNEKEARKVLLLIRMSNALEQLGDIAEDLGNLSLILEEKNIQLNSLNSEGLEKIYSKFLCVFNETKEKFLKKQVCYGKKATNRGAIEPFINKVYSSHIRDLKREQYEQGSIFVEAVSIFESAISKAREILILNNFYARIK